MISLAERLRVRSDKKPMYNYDESDDDFVVPKGKREGKEGKADEKAKRFVRDDAIGLNLLTTNSGDGWKAIEENEKPSDEIILQGELNRLGDENRQLRSMLDQVTENYSALYAQLLQVMQHQGVRENRFEEQKEKKSEMAAPTTIPAKQLMDPGQISMQETHEQHCRTSDADKEQFTKMLISHDDIPSDGASPSWGSSINQNQNPFSSTNQNQNQERISDQTLEFPCRKARVFMRIVLQAPSVHLIFLRADSYNRRNPLLVFCFTCFHGSMEHVDFLGSYPGKNSSLL